jgi:hypothetical protein
LNFLIKSSIKKNKYLLILVRQLELKSGNSKIQEIYTILIMISSYLPYVQKN